MSIFNSVKSVARGRNTFHFTPQRMMTCELGQIVPCYIQENIMPGTRVEIKTAQLVRLQALLAPLQHNVRAFVHFWFVPTRIIDPNFMPFLSGQNMRDSMEYDPPYFTYLGLCSEALSNNEDPRKYIQSGRLLDYLGFPIPQIFDSPDFNPNSDVQWDDMDLKFNVRRLQTYISIIWQKYVNQNAIDDDLQEIYDQFMNLDVTGDVSDSVCRLLRALTKLTDSGCFPHAWWKDYFTSALPFVQVGDPVSFSLGQKAPISINGGSNNLLTSINAMGTGTHDSDGGNVFYKQTATSEGQHYGKLQESHMDADGQWSTPIDINKMNLNISEDNELYADLSEAQSITINELRVAVALQSLKEAFARFGSRIQEWSLGFWKTMPTDQSLQIPQWLGGGAVPINITDIEQTAPTVNDSLGGDGTPLGTLAGKAVGFGSFRPVDVFCKEPGMIMGVLFLQPDTLYSNQGVDRFLLKRNNYFDYINPKTEHLGEQELLNCELNYSNDGNDNRDAFGYTARYAEYKMMRNEIHGQFATYLNFWHMARIFDGTPRLNPSFIYTQQADVKRPFAVQRIEDESGNPINIDSALYWLKFDVRMSARYSKYGTPMLLN